MPAQRHAVSDIYTTDHNRLPSVDCDAFGLTANVSGIKVWVIPLQCLVFSVCPTCYHLYPLSCVTFLSLIIFKIIPHPMTLLIAFPLQVIVSYFILHRLLSLTYHLITYLLSSSHIPSPCVRHTHHLHPIS
jgi:hypothetical protein